MNFASNAAVADCISVRVLFENEVLLIAVPHPREGVVHGRDWDAFGQRLTEDQTRIPASYGQEASRDITARSRS
jgi:hypothetical protein